MRAPTRLRWETPGIDADAYTGITAGGRIDDSRLGEVRIQLILLRDFRAPHSC